MLRRKYKSKTIAKEKMKMLESLCLDLFGFSADSDRKHNLTKGIVISCETHCMFIAEWF